MSQVVNYYYRRGLRPSVSAQLDELGVVSTIKGVGSYEPSVTLASLLIESKENIAKSTARVGQNIRSALDEASTRYNVPASYIMGAVLTYYAAPKLVPDYALKVVDSMASVALWISDGALFVYATYAINAQDPTSVRHAFFWHAVDDEVKKRLSYSIIDTIHYIAQSTHDKLSKLGMDVLARQAKAMISGVAIWLKHYGVARDVTIGGYTFDMVKHNGDTYLYSGLRLEPAPAIDQRLEWIMSKVYSVVGPSVLHARAIPTLVAAHPEVLRKAFSRDWWYAVLPLRDGEGALFLVDDRVCVTRSGGWAPRSDQECVLEVQCSEPYVRAVRQAEITSDVIHSALTWLIIRARLGLCNPDMYMAVRQISRLIAGQNTVQPTLG